MAFLCYIFGLQTQNIDCSDSGLEIINSYLPKKGKVYYSFQTNSEQHVQEISDVSSVGHGHIDAHCSIIKTYGTEQTSQKFLSNDLPEEKREKNALTFDTRLIHIPQLILIHDYAMSHFSYMNIDEDVATYPLGVTYDTTWYHVYDVWQDHMNHYCLDNQSSVESIDRKRFMPYQPPDHVEPGS